MVLVDTSIWVSHFRSGEEHLAALLESSEVLTHPYVIGELALGNLRRRDEILTFLRAVRSAEVADTDEVLEFIERNDLAGVGLGYVDVHLLAAARISRVPLWTADRPLQAAARRLSANYSRGGHT